MGGTGAAWSLCRRIAGPPAFFASVKRLGDFSALRFFSRYSCSFHDGLILLPLIYEAGGFDDGDDISPTPFHRWPALFLLNRGQVRQWVTAMHSPQSWPARFSSTPSVSPAALPVADGPWTQQVGSGGPS